jgi:PAS domain S-box-containing protein
VVWTLVGGAMWLVVGALVLRCGTGGRRIAWALGIVLGPFAGLTRGGEGGEGGGVSSAAEAILRLENAALALFIVHRDGRVAMANRAMRELLGYELDELVDRRLWELQVDPEAGRSSFQTLLTNGELLEQELVDRRRDGGIIATSSSAIVTTTEPSVIITVSMRS